MTSYSPACDAVGAEHVRNAVREQLDDEVGVVAEISGGSNGRIFRAESEDHGVLAVKQYLRGGHGSRERLCRELQALRFLSSQQVDCVPTPLSVDATSLILICTFIEASKLSAAEIDEDCIDQATDFAGLLWDLSRRPESDAVGVASEACFSFQQLVDSIGRRLERLMRTPAESALHTDMRLFLSNEVSSVFGELCKEGKQRLGENGIRHDQELARTERTLSPSDFGFHNALRRADGRLVFLDLEHFGWDDPAKLVCDFVLHPHESMKMADGLKRRFVSRMRSCFGTPMERLGRRLEVVYALYAIKWSTILLNEFVASDRDRRLHADGMKEIDEHVLVEQLKKARSMVNLARGGSGFPYLQ